MNKLLSALSPGVAKLIRESYPVAKRRSPLWFYKEEILSKYKVEKGKPLGPYDKKPEKLSKEQIRQSWIELSPELKRKYFIKARFDDIRCTEQKSLWMAEVGNLIATHSDKEDKLIKSVSDFERLNQEFLASIEKLHKDCEQMIQIDSTVAIFKDALIRAKRGKVSANSEELIKAVPEEHKLLVTQPQKPHHSFVIFVHENKERIKKLYGPNDYKVMFLTKAAEAWANLTKEEKKIYEDKYLVELAEYQKAMEKFHKENPDANNEVLIQASKERKLFNRTVRKRLRRATIVPVHVRNAFNFFVQDQKKEATSFDELAKIWRELTSEQKARYEQMSNEDSNRYLKDMAEYDKVVYKFETDIFFGRHANKDCKSKATT